MKRPPAAAPRAETEDKGVVEKVKEEKKEEKKTVPVLAGASEFKLSLGGFIQAQLKAATLSPSKAALVPPRLRSVSACAARASI